MMSAPPSEVSWRDPARGQVLDVDVVLDDVGGHPAVGRELGEHQGRRLEIPAELAEAAGGQVVGPEIAAGVLAPDALGVGEDDQDLCRRETRRSPRWRAARRRRAGRAWPRRRGPRAGRSRPGRGRGRGRPWPRRSARASCRTRRRSSSGPGRSARRRTRAPAKMRSTVRMGSNGLVRGGLVLGRCGGPKRTEARPGRPRTMSLQACASWQTDLLGFGSSGRQDIGAAGLGLEFDDPGVGTTTA